MPTLNGTPGGDNLVGTNGPDTLNGFEGDDALDGNGGVDQLFGGPGDDFLSIRSPPLAGGVFDGGEGTDTLYVSLLANASGVAGASLTGVSLVSLERLLFGETGGFLAFAQQTIYLDWVQLASFQPELVGRPGADTLAILVPAAGTYTLPDFVKTFWSFNDTVSLTALSSGNYTLSASASAIGIEALFGAAGNDRLNGNSGVNLLNGGGGDDILASGAGADRLTGGSGRDTFIDTRAGLAGDVITDFAVGDRIVLSDADPATFTFSLVGRTLSYSGGSITFEALLPAKIISSQAPEGGVQLATGFRFALNNNTGDFNGDHRDDILWRSDTGALSNWLGQANGGFFINDANALSFVGGNYWQIVGVGDFNGDARHDILWRNSDGMISNWLGTLAGGFVINDANAAYDLDAGWQVVGIGNFLTSQRDELLLRDAAGHLQLLGTTSAGGFQAVAMSPSNATTDWQVIGTADFNGDGLGDILWRRNDGLFSNWLNVGGGAWQPNDAAAQAFVATEWDIVATGDFNGDGRDDILWRSSSGALSNWLARPDGGFEGNDQNALVDVPIAWQVAGVGDFNGDGRDDILWRHGDTGMLSDWLGQNTGGFLINDQNAAANVPLEWAVMAQDSVFL
jgi:hypothetical protein